MLYSIAMDMPQPKARAPLHYTLRGSGRSSTTLADAESARERIAAELEEHYAETFSIRIETRKPGKSWTVLDTADVIHPDEPSESDAPAIVRCADLVEMIFNLVDAESIDGSPLAARAIGCGERPGKRVWESPVWMHGETMALSPGQLREESLSQHVVTSVRLAESSSRTAERLVARLDAQSQLLWDRSLAAAQAVMGFATDTAEKIRAAALPAVELARIEGEHHVAKMKHEETMEQQRIDAELLSHLIAVSVDALTGGGSAKLGGDASQCTEARTIAGVLEEIEKDTAKLAALRDLLTPDELGALAGAAKAKTIEEFDACFGKFYQLIVGRGREDASRIYAKLPEIVGPSIMHLHHLNTGYERRAKL